jgi:thioredoxin 1
MHDEAPFLSAVRDSPRDQTPRLIYADWLEERGDSRAEYIRNQCQLAKTDYGEEFLRLLERQRELRPGIDRSWLESMAYRHWPVELTEGAFDREMLQPGTAAIARFWAPWSGPCRQFSPIVREIADEFAGLAIVGNVNVDEQAALAQRYAISAIPMTLFFVDGKLAEQLVGLHKKDFVDGRVAALRTDASPTG